MNNYRDVIKAPIITEKTATLAQDGNVVVFSVDPKANKTQIKQAERTRSLVLVFHADKSFLQGRGISLHTHFHAPSFTDRIRRVLGILNHALTLDSCGNYGDLGRRYNAPIPKGEKQTLFIAALGVGNLCSARDTNYLSSAFYKKIGRLWNKLSLKLSLSFCRLLLPLIVILYLTYNNKNSPFAWAI